MLDMLQLESLPAMVAGVWSDDPTMQLEAPTQLRKLLSIGNSLEYMYLYYHFLLSLGNGHLKKYM